MVSSLRRVGLRSCTGECMQVRREDARDRRPGTLQGLQVITKPAFGDTGLVTLGTRDMRQVAARYGAVSGYHAGGRQRVIERAFGDLPFPSGSVCISRPCDGLALPSGGRYQ